MSDPARKLTEAERRKLINRGYHPVKVWLPDTTSAGYKAEAHRQANAAAEADVEDRVME
jgi:hypothetical protein